MLELEAEREQRQRDYDKKLLLAKSKIDNVQVRVKVRKTITQFVQIKALGVRVRLVEPRGCKDFEVVLVDKVKNSKLEKCWE